LKNIPIFQIGNIHSSNLDLSQFQRKHSDGKTILGVASMDRFSPLKGFQNVNSLEKYLSENKFPFEIKYLADYPLQIERKQDFWFNIDYLLVLSNADNSPNVIHEAKIHGVPVIGSNVGGIPELLSPAYDFCVDIDLDMPSRILDFLRGKLSVTDPELSQKISSDYKVNSREILRQFISAYNHILSD
jgi:glycosyltransferase involved in cell wall biosynthesis